MKAASRFLFCLVLLSLLAAACSGGSDEPVAEETPAAPATEVPAEMPATEVPVEPTAAPAPTEVPGLSADEQIAAAVAAYDANPLPAGLKGWDHRNAQFLENRVRLELCVWDGASVFESLHIAEYSVEATASGAQATPLFDNTLAGSCESDVIGESLFIALSDFDNFWAPVLADPTTFDPAEAAKYNTDDLVSVSSSQVQGWTDGGLSWRQAVYDGQLPASAVADVLWRRFNNAAGTEIVEVLACRQMAPDFGLYRGDVVVDNFKSSVVGPHGILVYTVVRDDGQWLVDNVDSNSYSDCFGDRWLEVANEWRPDPVSWQVLADA